MNTMADLRKECASRLREELHGREIDMLENTIELPHMLGIVPVGAQSNRQVESGTILDPNHHFWQNYEEDVNTRGSVKRKVQSAIRSLKKDDIFRMTYPYGEEADIVYCEVDSMESNGVTLPTRCAECREQIEVPLTLRFQDTDVSSGKYSLALNISCPHCGFSEYSTSRLQKL